MNAILSWFRARLAEPSTWAGIAAGASAIEQAMHGNTAGLAGVLTGLLAIVIPEAKSAATPTPGGK